VYILCVYILCVYILVCMQRLVTVCIYCVYTYYVFILCIYILVCMQQLVTVYADERQRACTLKERLSTSAHTSQSPTKKVHDGWHSDKCVSAPMQTQACAHTMCFKAGSSTHVGTLTRM